MARWAIVVLVLYLLALVSLTVPLTILAFIPEVKPGNVAVVYLHWQYWVLIFTMIICQAGLLATPVRQANRKPVTKGPLWLTILASGFMSGLLVLGAILTIAEGIFGTKEMSENLNIGALIVAAISWLIWGIIFFRASQKTPPTDLVTKQCKVLYKGSVLELLIAVPTHVIARSRDECCAGFGTFVGLTMGVAVMLFSYGPAVFFLYVERWNKLQSKMMDRKFN